jgi:hypothetical protein
MQVFTATVFLSLSPRERSSRHRLANHCAAGVLLHAYVLDASIRFTSVTPAKAGA